ncbi:MAG: hypothetical protein GF398_13920 [Chitinivibrionales bacterium]|nr:hypothetical protein [Chitinivibrionales bacterium]
MNKRMALFALATAVCIQLAPAQTAQAYADDTQSSPNAGLLDPSRLKVNHSMSFGMSATGKDDVISQSLYATMLQYKFTAPVTLNLNFGFPLHSSYAPDRNLNATNVKSADYFRNMPLNMHLTWQPNDNFMMRFSVVRDNDPYYSEGPFPSFDRNLRFNSW